MRPDSGSGSVSTVSREDYLALSSEDSSSTPDWCGLGLDLSLGENVACSSKVQRPTPKILTAEDLLDAFCSSSSASSTLTRGSGIAGTERAATNSIAPSNAYSQVVGWPPVGTHRMNSMAYPGRSPPKDELQFKAREDNSNVITQQQTKSGLGNVKIAQQGLLPTSSYIKVSMDGVAIGRKVDPTAHNSYESLAYALEKMFAARNASASANATRLTAPSGTTIFSKLLDGSSGYVLTYKDKEGDWMLVGDVPWGMFVNSVKRLRIMTSSEAKGISKQM